MRHVAVDRLDRERRDETLRHVVGPVGDDGRARPPVARAEDPVVHVVDRRARRGGDRRRAAHLDDLGAALRDARDERVDEPLARRRRARRGGRPGAPAPTARRRSRATTSGNCVAEWLPQIATSRISPTGVPTEVASCPSARLWSSRVSAVNRSAGTSGACAAAMSAFVFAGLPTTTMRTSSAAPALIASPCGPKMPPFATSRSPRSMPAVRGRAPTSRPRFAPRKAAVASSWTSTCASSGNAAVLQLERRALGRAHALRDLEQVQPHRGVGTEQVARGDAEEQGVADLPAGARDGDRDRFDAHAASLRRGTDAVTSRASPRRP